MDQFFLNQMPIRKNQYIRNLVADTHFLNTSKFIQPIFVAQGIQQPRAIEALPDIYHDTAESILLRIEEDIQKGIQNFLLFIVPNEKTEKNFSMDFGAKIIQKIKQHFANKILLMVDVCLCSYTTSGHCGVVEKNKINISASVEAITRCALLYAQAGADVVAPSDMMDGRIQSIHQALKKTIYNDVLIMSYSTKFHSCMYGPFRLAAESQPFGELHNRSTYQIDPRNSQDAFACSYRDAQQGADILMIKPGLPYLDILAKLSKEIKKPWAVYQVSAEYTGIELLAQHGYINRSAAYCEQWTAFFRAGAHMIITYAARLAKDYIKKEFEI